MRRAFGMIAALALALPAAAATTAGIKTESYQAVAMPPGVHVEKTELDGAVFADVNGRTLYTWPFRALRNGATGDPEGKSVCDDTPTRVSAGFMSPYPPGLILPDLDARRACAQEWPPFLAGEDAKPIGAWSVITRKDGKKQWAYDQQPVYTSFMDHAPGDVIGASSKRIFGETAVLRFPVQPPADVPPGFIVVTTLNGRLLTTSKNASVYSFDKDTATKSACDDTCAQTWQPVRAPEFARPHGEWSLLDRAPGVRQWVFRGRPLYTSTEDVRPYSLEGSDVPGWHNVYTQLAPPAPADFATHVTDAGLVLADSRGKTVYFYNCGDDSVDQLDCDHPDTTQAYRLAVCGGGDADVCLKNFPPVLASKNAKSTSRAWTIVYIDPKTGHFAKAGDPGALGVWAYRDRPLYTYSKDEPGDINAEGLGEFRSHRHGFIAFWIRDDFYGRENQ